MLAALKNNSKIIVNTDIDGIFSALVLHNFLGCEIAGFCNSAETVWIDQSKIASIYDGVYIDMFVPRADVVCIDQHIVAVDEEHYRAIAALGTKFNPNLDNPRFHLPSSSYYLKYPFGTVHYIIAHLEKNGLNLDLQLDNLVGQNLLFKDLLLRADDTMQTTVSSPYVQNAKDWWSWLKDFSEQGKTITQICDYLHSLNSADVAAKKTAATKLLKDLYHCDSPDGGFKNIGDKNGFLQEKVKKYIRFLAKISGLKVFDLEMKLEKKVGKAHRISLDTVLQSRLKTMNTEIFSYAFVRSAARTENFSYTKMS